MTPLRFHHSFLSTLTIKWKKEQASEECPHNWNQETTSRPPPNPTKTPANTIARHTLPRNGTTKQGRTHNVRKGGHLQIPRARINSLCPHVTIKSKYWVLTLIWTKARVSIATLKLSRRCAWIVSSCSSFATLDSYFPVWCRLYVFAVMNPNI